MSRLLLIYTKIGMVSADGPDPLNYIKSTFVKVLNPVFWLTVKINNDRRPEPSFQL